MDSLKLHITQEKKLRTYALFKTTFKFEPYLDTLSDFTTRSSFAKLRLSAHSLQIETGRYEVRKTPKEERYCGYCKTLGNYLVEDEAHFLVSCPLFNEERVEIHKFICKKFPSVNLLNETNTMIWLLSQEDVCALELIGNFCKKSFKIREKTLKILHTNTNKQ